MKIAVCQTNNIIGDIQGNKAKIISGYRKGVDDGADLVIFPELTLTGYPPLDLVEKKEFRQAVFNAADEIAAITGSTGLLFGSITEDDDNIGTDIHNSAVLCYDGKIQFLQHKTLIPNYDVFDEMRYFDAARGNHIYEFKGEKLGISICEDIWNDADYWHIRRYNYDPVENLIKEGATILLNISASPYAYGKRDARRKMLSLLTRQNNIPLVYVCFVGAQTELIFDGASMCLDKDGNLVLLGEPFREDYFIFNTDEKLASIQKAERSFEEEVHDALIFGLREYCSKLGIKKAVLGLSGGIDSAVIAYIAVKAIGKDNVNALLMPSKYSSSESLKDAKILVRNLGISSTKITIHAAVSTMEEKLKNAFQNDIAGITEENIQARIRGMYLMAYSNRFGNLLLTTGNKSEIAVGYATLYGDMAGGLAVIGDLYKTEVYKLAHFINKDKEIIPPEIINKEPSAELKKGQTDQDTLPPYDLLDRILRMYLEENKEYQEISRVIGDEDTVVKVLRMVDHNEFKRKQAAPVLRVSKKAFGYGRRYPIVQGWRK
jgi:NAD+ synthase (glutamine-hydrolysing)